MIYRSTYLLMFSLLFAAGLAGCIKERDEGPGEGKERPVVFAPQVSSRAAAGHPIENGATIPVGDYYFGVYAWVKPTTAGSVEPFAELQNAKVQHAASAEYTYSPVASWPRDADARLACMAYYPWSDQSGNIRVITGTGANRTMTIDYTVPTDAGQHVDLMYAKTGMTAGYDPVNLDFRHALARLKFEGRTEGFPAGSVVKITGIKVTGAVLRGDLIVLDPATQPGKPWWELSTAPGDVGAITMPATHIKDLPLTSALQSVITPGGDMLVLPQSVTGLTVEVTASQGGTAFPEPFVFSLTLSPDWTMNEIITYEITLMPDGMHLTAKVASWTTDPVNVVYDGQWWLEVNEDYKDLDPAGGEWTITASTNYNIGTQGYPAGLQVNESDIVYTPAVAPGGEWLTLTDQNGGSNGDLIRTIKITAVANTTDAERSVKINLRAGNLTKVINIEQEVNSIARGFARSNIVWDADNQRLTFAEEPADNDRIPANSQGVFFMWGSLVAVSPAALSGSVTTYTGAQYPGGHILYSPTGTYTYAWASIPYIDEIDPPFDNVNNSRSDDFATYNNGTGYDASADKGDICRYISAQAGWVKGKWRLPTAGEISDLVGEGYDGYGTWTNIRVVQPGSNAYGNHAYGFYQPPGGYMFGAGANANDNPLNPSVGVHFTAGGYRNNADGTANYAGSNGFSWTGSSYSTSEGYYSLINVPPGTPGRSHSSRQLGLPVRCIRDL